MRFTAQIDLHARNKCSDTVTNRAQTRASNRPRSTFAHALADISGDGHPSRISASRLLLPTRRAKGAFDPVTEADRAAERGDRAGLSRSAGPSTASSARSSARSGADAPLPLGDRSHRRHARLHHGLAAVGHADRPARRRRAHPRPHGPALHGRALLVRRATAAHFRSGERQAASASRHAPCASLADAIADHHASRPVRQGPRGRRASRASTARAHDALRRRLLRLLPARRRLRRPRRRGRPEALRRGGARSRSSSARAGASRPGTAGPRPTAAASSPPAIRACTSRPWRPARSEPEAQATLASTPGRHRTPPRSACARHPSPAGSRGARSASGCRRRPSPAPRKPRSPAWTPPCRRSRRTSAAAHGSAPDNRAARCARRSAAPTSASRWSASRGRGPAPYRAPPWCATSARDRRSACCLRRDS